MDIISVKTVTNNTSRYVMIRGKKFNDSPDRYNYVTLFLL